jgi:hypothetical protein
MEVALRLELVRPDPTPSASCGVREASRRLMLAVLGDALATFRRTAAAATRDDERTFVETVHWFASDDASDPLGFLGICRALELDAAYLRQGLRSIRARARAARPERVLH